MDPFYPYVSNSYEQRTCLLAGDLTIASLSTRLFFDREGQLGLSLSHHSRGWECLLWLTMQGL